MDPWYFLDIEFESSVDPYDHLSEYPNGTWELDCPVVLNNIKYTRIVFDNEYKSLRCFREDLLVSCLSLNWK